MIESSNMAKSTLGIQPDRSPSFIHGDATLGDAASVELGSIQIPTPTRSTHVRTEMRQASDRANIEPLSIDRSPHSRNIHSVQSGLSHIVQEDESDRLSRNVCNKRVFKIAGLFALIGTGLGAYLLLNQRRGPTTGSICTQPARASRQQKQKVERLLQTLVTDDVVRSYLKFEVPCLENVVLPENQTSYLGLRIFPGQPEINSGMRSELSIDFPFTEGDTISYRWGIMLEENFQYDQSKIKWWLFAQFHDQPIPYLNQNWADFPKHSPPVALYYGRLGEEDALVLDYLDQQNKDNQTIIKLNQGQWTDIRLDVQWSQNSTGSIAVGINGEKPSIQSRGANMLNAYQHYFKIGQYRNPEIDTDNTVFIRNIDIHSI